MSYAYKCPVCGGGFTESDTPVLCCGAERTTYACGLPPQDFSEPPNIIGDELHGKRRKFDWAAGQRFDSKSERRRVLAAKGLSEMGFGEARREGLLGDHPSPTKTISFGGQTKR